MAANTILHSYGQVTDDGYSPYDLPSFFNYYSDGQCGVIQNYDGIGYCSNFPYSEDYSNDYYNSGSYQSYEYGCGDWGCLQQGYVCSSTSQVCSQTSC